MHSIHRVALIAAALGGFFEPTRSTLCGAEPAIAPPGNDPAKPPVAPPPAGTPPEKPEKEPDITLSTDALNARLARAERKALKDAGFEDLDHAKRIAAEHAAQTKAAEEAKRAQMSEIERLTADLAKKDQEAASLAATAAEAQERAEFGILFAEKGVKNAKYGFFALREEKRRAKEAGETFSAAAFLEKELGDPASAAALGIVAPLPPVAPITVPLSTRPGGGPPVPPPPSNQTQAPVDFRSMTAEQMQQYRRNHGL